jgi:NAD(P)-dependent dehydrogenase (short-subunit alcohol dehydrogenase family)
MQTTVITGGTGGIGLATAARLLSRSSDRYVALVDLKPGGAIPKELVGFAGRVRSVACDVSDPDAVAGAAEEITESMPPMDSLVNGAGFVSNDATIDVPIELFRKMMAVHVDGTLLWSQALARSLSGAPGAIVNIGSVAGQFAIPRRAAYATAKAAIHSLTKTMAVEWVPLGIRVNAVAPGYVQTPMVEELNRLGVIDEQEVASWHAMKRLATPDEIAGVIEFLLSDAASFITGHVLYADGGFSVFKFE